MSNARAFLETFIIPALPNPHKSYCVGRAVYYPFTKPFVFKVSVELTGCDDSIRIYGLTFELLHKANGAIDKEFMSLETDLGLKSYSLYHARWVNSVALPTPIIIDSKIKPLIKNYLKAWGLLEEE